MGSVAWGDEGEGVMWMRFHARGREGDHGKVGGVGAAGDAVDAVYSEGGAFKHVFDAVGGGEVDGLTVAEGVGGSLGEIGPERCVHFENPNGRRTFLLTGLRGWVIYLSR